MKSQITKVLEVADRITAMAESALAGLDLSMSKWPADYRAIVWQAVADIATRRAEAAKRTT